MQCNAHADTGRQTGKHPDTETSVPPGRLGVAVLCMVCIAFKLDPTKMCPILAVHPWIQSDPN